MAPRERPIESFGLDGDQPSETLVPIDEQLGVVGERA
jgi:hypothetical protein